MARNKNYLVFDVKDTTYFRNKTGYIKCPIAH